MHIPVIAKNAFLAASIAAFAAPALAIQVHNEQGGGTVFIDNHARAFMAGADNGRFGNLCQDTRPLLYSTLAVTAPQQIALDDVVNAFASVPLTLFVTGDGKVYFCGRNPITNVSVYAPTQLPGTENMKVLQAGAMSNYREVFLRTADSIYKYSASTQTPVKIYGDYETQEMSFGAQHWVMNSRYGAVGYGDNSRGQLGQSVPAVVTTPTRLAGIYPIKIQAAYNVTVWKDVMSGGLLSIGSSEYLTPGINPVTIRTGGVADFSVMRNAITILGFDGKLSTTGWHNYIGAGLYNWSQFPHVDTFTEFADATAVFAGSDTLWASTPRGLFALGGNTGASGIGTIEESHTWAQVKNFNVSEAMTCTANDALVAENESLKADKALLTEEIAGLTSDKQLLESTNEHLTADLKATKDQMSLVVIDRNATSAKLTVATAALTKLQAEYASMREAMLRAKSELSTAQEDLKWAKVRIAFLESLPQLKGVLQQETKPVIATQIAPVKGAPFVAAVVTKAAAAPIAPTKVAPVAASAAEPKPATQAVNPKVATTVKAACNNGVGNGADGCTPGKAPVANDENGATKGSPAAKGGTASVASSAKK